MFENISKNQIGTRTRPEQRVECIEKRIFRRKVNYRAVFIGGGEKEQEREKEIERRYGLASRQPPARPTAIALTLNN